MSELEELNRILERLAAHRRAQNPQANDLKEQIARDLWGQIEGQEIKEVERVIVPEPEKPNIPPAMKTLREEVEVLIAKAKARENGVVESERIFNSQKRLILTEVLHLLDDGELLETYECDTPDDAFENACCHLTDLPTEPIRQYLYEAMPWADEVPETAGFLAYLDSFNQAADAVRSDLARHIKDPKRRNPWVGS